MSGTFPHENILLNTQDAAGSLFLQKAGAKKIGASGSQGMSKQFVQRTPFLRVGNFGPKQLAGNTSIHRRPLVGSNDSAEASKWPRPLRLVVALAFGSSVWIAILTRIQL